ncbi:hypothetical protein [Brachybacterium paraconglomeratum]|uniref:hypothetical protein n=1 Tax=Brachybacterium paraconglomeratum TaxID=173362 RepID=UPI0022E82F60|nr:hypothetical protein [Brachybacterium paraconglomeratum]
MSQPPQNPWGQPPSDDQYGQQSANGGHGQGPQPYGQQQGYGEGYGQQGYSQGSPSGAYGQPSPNTGYGQDSRGWGQAPSAAPAFGADAQQPYAQHAEPPKKSSKTPLLICAGCAVLALIVLLVGGGIFLFTRDGGEPTDDRTTSEQATTEDGEEPTEEDATTEEATSEEATTEEATEAAADGKGTKDAPYAIGEKFTVEDGEGGTLDVTIGDVNWDATDEVMGANEFNEEPGEGETYILVPVSMTYHGDGTSEPGFSLMVDYVTEGGNSYSDAGSVTPKSWIDVGTLHDGGTGEWEIGILIPADQAKNGHFAVSPLLNFSAEDVWVKAA